jgi:hypothetical protein
MYQPKIFHVLTRKNAVLFTTYRIILFKLGRLLISRHVLI